MTEPDEIEVQSNDRHWRSAFGHMLVKYPNECFGLFVVREGRIVGYVPARMGGATPGAVKRERLGRDFFERVRKMGGTGIVTVHSHIAGGPPTREDVASTEQFLRAEMQRLGLEHIPVVGHATVVPPLRRLAPGILDTVALFTLPDAQSPSARGLGKEKRAEILRTCMRDPSAHVHMLMYHQGRLVRARHTIHR